MNIYCSCGFPNPYKTVKPTFCSKCGVKLGVTVASNPTAPSPIQSAPVYRPPQSTTPSLNSIFERKRRQFELELLEEEEALESLPDIDGLSFAVEDLQHKPLTLEDAIFSNPIHSDAGVKYRKVKKKFSQDTLNKVMSNAKAKISSTDIGGSIE